MIQLIDKQYGKFCMKIHDIDCIFMPMELFVDYQFLPLNKIVKGSTLGWNVNRKFVSYWQIKKTILATSENYQNNLSVEQAK